MPYDGRRSPQCRAALLVKLFFRAKREDKKTAALAQSYRKNNATKLRG